MNKKVLTKTLALAALFMMQVGGAKAEVDFGTDDVISSTTLWTFDQYLGGEKVSKGTLVNYKGLYLYGHGTNEMLINRTSKTTISSFGGQDVIIYSLLRSKTGRDAAGKKASGINNATIAFNASVAGTVYVYARVENADKNMTIAFNNTKVLDADVTDGRAYNVYTYTSTEAGCFAIAGAGAYQIGAVKFVPTVAPDPVPTKTIKMSDMGLMTFSDVQAWAIPSGLKVWTVKKTTVGQNLQLTEIKTAIPAGTGVILQGTHNQEYTLTATDAAATARDINYSLRPVVIDYALPATYSTGDADNNKWDNYILVKDGDNMVFKQSNGNGNIAAGKAYFCIRRDQAEAAAARFTLDFGDDETTGISNVEHSTLNIQHYYDLKGQRVENPTKGLYILNGKKVIMK